MVETRLTRTEVEFGVLGPLLAAAGSHRVEVTGAKERCLLAFLLLHANETVSVETLIDALWPDDPPATARNTLQAHVSRLRKAIGRRRLATFANGYSLSAGPEELDLFRFRDLVAHAHQDREKGELGQSAQGLSEALALWRGEPLPEFRSSSVFHAALGPIEEERIAAFEAWVEAELDLGGGDELVSELEAAVEANPTRERLMGQLMVALYRAGRQVEALEAYGRARQSLCQELGLEPGPLLRELHRRILTHDPTLTPPRRSAPRHGAAPSRRNLTIVVAVPLLSRELDPEAATRILEDTRTRATTILEDHGAVVSSPGDAVVGTFGLPVSQEDDPHRAVRSAMELSEEGAISVAVDTGVALASDSTLIDDRLVADLARLAHAGRAAEVVVRPGARDALGSAVEVVDSVLVSFDPRAEVIPRRFGAPLIGREHEFDRLQESFRWAIRNRSSHLVTILGPAGIGKSRLARELVTTVADEATVLTGRCLAYGSGAFWPLSEMVTQAAGDTTPEALLDLLAGLEDGRPVVDQLAAALGTGTGLRAEDASWAFRKLFGALAADRPLVLVFDDLHWAEELLLDFIEELIERTDGVPMLIVCLARPDLLEQRASWGGCRLDAESILLAPLSEESSEALIHILGETVSDATRAQIVTRAEGNPLFIEQLVALAVEEPSAAPDAIPISIQSVLAARIDRLAPDERVLLERASIIGLEFSLSSAALLCRDVLPNELMSATARRLVAKELLRPVGPGMRGREDYRFGHILARDVVYASVLKSTRAELHERFARWLEGLGDRQSEIEEIVGYHLERAYELRVELQPETVGWGQLANEAGERFASAGAREIERSNLNRGVSLLERALQLLASASPARGYALRQLSYASRLKGDWSAARRHLKQGFAQAESAGDEALKASLEVTEVQLRLHTDPTFALEEFARVASRALDALRGLRSPHYEAQVQGVLAWAYALLGQYRACIELVDGLEKHERGAEYRRLLPNIWLMGEFTVDEAVARCEALLSERPPPRTTASCYRSLAVLRAMQGQFGNARRLYELQRRVIGDLAMPILREQSVTIIGTVELLAGRPRIAERALRRAIASLERLGTPMNVSGLSAQLVRALMDQRRDDEAWSVLEFAKASPASDVSHLVDVLGVRARLLACRGSTHEAEETAREAVSIADKTDSPDIQACARLDLAHALMDCGKNRRGKRVGAEALRLFEQKGNLVEAAQSRRLLASQPR